MVFLFHFSSIITFSTETMSTCINESPLFSESLLSLTSMSTLPSDVVRDVHKFTQVYHGQFMHQIKIDRSKVISDGLNNILFDIHLKTTFLLSIVWTSKHFAYIAEAFFTEMYRSWEDQKAFLFVMALLTCDSRLVLISKLLSTHLMDLTLMSTVLGN